MKPRLVAIALIVVGLVATAAGLFGQVFLREDEGHHDGPEFTFALESSRGVDELVVTSKRTAVNVSVERSSQPLVLEPIHDGYLDVFVASTDLTSIEHFSSGRDESDSTPALISLEVPAPAGEVRVATLATPSGGPELLELGATVEVDGDKEFEPQNISETDEWTDADLTIRRQGFDFVLSEPWNGDDTSGSPASIALFRGDDLAFTHGHAELVGDNRFSFSLTLPGAGDYLALLEFEQDGVVVDARFRITI